MCMCLHFVKCLKSPLPTVCPVPAELGLDCAVLVDKSLYGRFLNLSPVGIWVWIICCGDCRCILEWLAAFLASSHWMPVTSPELVQPKISLGLCQKSPEWQKSPRLKIADLECLSVSPVAQLWAFPSHLVSPCCQPCSQPLCSAHLIRWRVAEWKVDSAGNRVGLESGVALGGAEHAACRWVCFGGSS